MLVRSGGGGGTDVNGMRSRSAVEAGSVKHGSRGIDWAESRECFEKRNTEMLSRLAGAVARCCSQQKEKRKKRQEKTRVRTLCQAL